MHKVTFNNKPAPFYTELKKRVDQYFEENQISKTGNFRLYFKSFVLISTVIVSYTWLLFFTPPWYLSIFFAIILGLSLTFVGFNVMHDACHGSYSKNKWVNRIMGLSMNALGSNAQIWKLKHNIIHHTYTNVDGIDDDIELEPLVRQCESQPKRKMHKYQHLYMFVLYSLATFFWSFFTDFKKYFLKKINNTPLNNFELRHHILFWVSKLAYGVFYIALPIYMVGFQYWLVGFIIVNCTMGLTLSLVFQTAHVVEITHFDEANLGDKRIEDEWAIHQIKTTADYSAGNKFLTWCLGGLNYQVIHHLFPRISHIHYPNIQKIVKETCDEFNVKYLYFNTFRAAIISHYRFMRTLGN